MNYFYAYLIFISVVAVIITLYDKKAAQKGKRRIRERTLMLVSVLGGSVCMYVTMLAIRHKTKHKKFMIGIPLIIVLQAIALFASFFYSVDLL